MQGNVKAMEHGVETLYTRELLEEQLPPELLAKASDKAAKRGVPLEEYAEEAGRYYSSGMLRRFCHACLLMIGLLNGLSAPPSSAMMMIAPDGSLLHMESFIPLFQDLPFADIFFQDLFWPGVALTLVNGIPNLVACWMIITRKKRCYHAATICGLLLIAWALTEIFVIKIPPAGSLVYLVLGCIQTASGIFMVVSDSKQQATLPAARVNDADFTVCSMSVYTAKLWMRFVRGFVVVVCIGNAVSAIPSGIRLMGDYAYSGIGIGLGTVLIVVAGVLSVIALPPLLRREARGYALGVLCGVAFTAWTAFETVAIGAYPTGWLEYLAQGSGSLNLTMGILTTLFSAILLSASRKKPGVPVA